MLKLASNAWSCERCKGPLHWLTKYETNDVDTTELVCLQCEFLKHTGQIDIILRTLQGDDEAFLANDYGGTGWEREEPVAEILNLISCFQQSQKEMENLRKENEDLQFRGWAQ